MIAIATNLRQWNRNQRSKELKNLVWKISIAFPSKGAFQTSGFKSHIVKFSSSCFRCFDARENLDVWQINTVHPRPISATKQHDLPCQRRRAVDHMWNCNLIKAWWLLHRMPRIGTLMQPTRSRSNFMQIAITLFIMSQNVLHFTTENRLCRSINQKCKTLFASQYRLRFNRPREL